MSKPFYKRNYSQGLRYLIPELYRVKDEEGKSEYLDSIPAHILGEIEVIQGFSNIFQITSDPIVVSSLGWNGTYFEELPGYFIKNNQVNEITPQEFEVEVLQGLGYSLKDYSTKEEFAVALSSIILPKLRIGVTNSLESLSVNTDFAFGDKDDETFNYLLNSLGLFFILNYDLGDPTYNTNLYEHIVEPLSNLVVGKSVSTLDAITALKEYIFINQNKLSLTFKSLFANLYLSGVSSETSGTQQLDNLKVITSIIHSPAYAQKGDTYYRDFINDYFISSYIYLPSTEYTLFYNGEGFAWEGLVPTRVNEYLTLVREGNFSKLIKAFGYLMSDIDDQIVTLESIASIQDCPDSLLPYLADMIGWTLYTGNPESWRRQLWNALELLHKKGSKEGLKDLLSVVLPSLDLDFDNNYSEFYESYIPNLLYYIIKTESEFFQLSSTWTFDKALSETDGEFVDGNPDHNIRVIVDHILLKSCKLFPYLFSIRGRKFNLEDPEFIFNYRGRDFKMPPWEYEKFYKDCDVTSELIEFIKNRLICVGVSVEMANAFEDYVLSNTVSSIQPSELYNNAFLFVTKNLQLPPNYKDIVESFSKRKIELIPYWSSKSSQFNLTLAEGTTDDTFFKVSAYTQDDFFEALKATKDFIPATTIARLHADLSHAEASITNTKVYPRLKQYTYDIIRDGAVAGYSLSSLDMRNESLGLLASAIDAGYDFANEQSQVKHEELPVFKRDRTLLSREINDNQLSTIFYETSGIFNASGPIVAINSGRSTKRRRNLKQVIPTCTSYLRTGFLQPTFYNEGTTGASDVEFLSLGLIPSSNVFTDVSSHLSLPQVYRSCETLGSSSTINGVDTSTTFPCRGVDLDIAENHDYVYRDVMDECYKIFYDKFKSIEYNRTLEEIKHNSHISSDNHIDQVQSYFNDNWENYEITTQAIMNFEFGRDLNLLYNRYSKKILFDFSNSVLSGLTEGGRNVISHTYGPLVYNGHMSVEGPALGNTGTNIKTNSILEFNKFLTTSSTSVLEPLGSQDISLASNEFYNPYFVSGVEIVDSVKSKKNYMLWTDLSSDEGLADRDAVILNNNLLLLRSAENSPRVRFRINGTDNLLLPDCTYTIDISSLFIREDSPIVGGGAYSVWIRTGVEQDALGRNVSWFYTPQETWVPVYVDNYTPSPIKKLISEKYAFTYNSEDASVLDRVSCQSSNLKFRSFLSVSSGDLDHMSITFNTLNRNALFEKEYYKSQSQLHREDQEYFIEIMPSKSQAPSYFCLDKVSVVNQNLKNAVNLKYNRQIKDLTYTTVDDGTKVAFLYPDGTVVPLLTSITLDEDGILTANGKRLTLCTVRDIKGRNAYKKILYKKAKGRILLYNSLYGDSTSYTGTFQQLSFALDKFNIDKLSIQGLEYGTEVYKDVVIEDGLDPEDLLIVLRLFRNMAEGDQSRNQTYSYEDYNVSGGTRISYRQWPSVGNTAALENYNNLDTIRLVN